MAKKADDNIDDLTNENDVKATSKNVTEKYKTEKCKVLSYDEKTRELDIDFNGYGIRLNNVDDVKSDIVLIKYHGEIGKPNFSCKL